MQPLLRLPCRTARYPPPKSIAQGSALASSWEVFRLEMLGLHRLGAEKSIAQGSALASSWEVFRLEMLGLRRLGAEKKHRPGECLGIIVGGV